MKNRGFYVFYGFGVRQRKSKRKGPFLEYHPMRFVQQKRHEIECNTAKTHIVFCSFVVAVITFINKGYMKGTERNTSWDIF